MRRFIYAIGVALLPAVLVLTGFAHAASVTFQFSGTVTSVDNPQNRLDGSVVIGTPISGAYTFNSATPDSDSDPTLGSYLGTLSFWITEVGNYTFNLNPVNSGAISVGNDVLPGQFNQDSYAVNGPIVPEWDVSIILIVAGPNISNALTSDSLPLTPPDVSLFTNQHNILIRGIGNSFRINGNLDSLTLAPVPEPTTVLLLGSGLIGLAGYGRKKFFKK